jgi:8-amino-7-oxononanoate synthase
MFDFLQNNLEKQALLHRYRRRTLVSQVSGSEISVADKKYLNFSSNDYLGLNNHKLINKAMQEGIDKFGLCASSSSLITGYSYAHQSLESTICDWLNKTKCLLFSSGFAANLGVLQALGDKHSYFWLDKLSHASIIDGALNSNAQTKRFLHNDIAQLSSYIDKVNANISSKAYAKNHLIVSEGVFSMDGDKADIKALSHLAQQKVAMLYIDDAHSIGIMGDQGQGSISQAPIDVVMATFGKAVATSGAFVACDETLFEYLVNFSRHYIYSTAISPAVAWATKTSISLVQQEHWRREKIIELSQLFKRKLKPDIKLISADTSIHAIVIGSEKKTLALSEFLKTQGIWVSAIRPPTVANNQSRLRVTICANHKDKDIIYLAKVLNENIN